MKIAAIIITYNDGYKFKEWCEHYEEYKDEIFLHIIVDNGSEESYLRQLKDYFKDSVIIERSTNGGCTGAYNTGIRHALQNPEVDSIALIANDMKLKKGCLTNCYSFLKSDPDLGMVEPVILEKDSMIINDFGCSISKTLRMISYKAGYNLNDIKETTRYAEAVTGGMNLASREFYEKVGLQDEKLFMYSDEVDMGIRAKKAGFKMAVTKEALAWHQHINPKERKIRLPFSAFLIGRNKPYLAHKHFGLLRAIYVFIYQLGLFTKLIFKSLNSGSKIKFQFFFLFGTICGFLGIMKNFDFIINNK